MLGEIINPLLATSEVASFTCLALCCCNLNRTCCDPRYTVVFKVFKAKAIFISDI
jgi:hypothetical protein